MENKAYALAAGLFTLLLGASVIVAAMWFSGKTEAQETYFLESRFPVTGLNLQAPVRLRGVDVGKVASIQFDPDDPRLILIGIAVNSATPLTRGTIGQLGSQGVTGLSYVMLDDDGSKPELLPPSRDKTARIPVRSSFIDELSGSGKDLIAEFGQVARRLSALLDEKNQEQLMRTLASVETVAGRVVALAHDIQPVAGNVTALTADARQTLQRADTLLANLNSLTQQLAQRADTLDRVAKSAEQVGGSAQSFSSAALTESMPRINQLLEELARNSRNLDRLLIEVNEQPATLLFGRPPAAPGPGEPGFNQQRGSGR
jgi:phospholipid/cholesterol/gamma-HCH transport system substrate-binding protein